MQNVINLSLVSVNEKIYVFIWFWLIFLALITVLGIVYHLLLLTVPYLTKSLIDSGSMRQYRVFLEVDIYCQL